MLSSPYKTHVPWLWRCHLEWREFFQRAFQEYGTTTCVRRQQSRQSGDNRLAPRRFRRRHARRCTTANRIIPWPDPPPHAFAQLQEARFSGHAYLPRSSRDGPPDKHHPGLGHLYNYPRRPSSPYHSASLDCLGCGYFFFRSFVHLPTSRDLVAPAFSEHIVTRRLGAVDGLLANNTAKLVFSMIWTFREGGEGKRKK
ncbi:hypothetical protein MRX96_054395 [Rhipicephalus microplus]